MEGLGVFPFSRVNIESSLILYPRAAVRQALLHLQTSRLQVSEIPRPG